MQSSVILALVLWLWFLFNAGRLITTGRPDDALCRGDLLYLLLTTSVAVSVSLTISRWSD